MIFLQERVGVVGGTHYFSMQHKEPRTQVEHSNSTVSSDNEDLARHGRKENDKENNQDYKGIKGSR